MIQASHLALQGPLDLALQAPVARGAAAPHLDEVERDLIVQALEACGWNVTKAAQRLGISRDTLRYRMEKHGLSREV
jgi:transcriptional regulator of acetoin/glycerol metabolism